MKNTSQILLLSIILIGCFFLIHSANFAYPVRGIYSDITVTHYPNAIFIRNSITNFSQIPLWNPSILGGYPFISDPLSGLLYIPLWLTVILPLPFAFNFLIFLHWAFSCWGMYRFLIKEGLIPDAALIGAMMWMCLPKLWTHFAAGHITLLLAISWTPWLLLSIKSAIIHKENREWLFPGLVIGVMALADIRWVPFALLLSFPFSLYTLHFDPDKKKASQKFILLWGLIAIVSLSVAAVLLIPLFRSLLYTNRSGMSLADITALSIPWTKLSELVLPVIGENTETITYMGIGGLLCLVLAIASPKIRPRAKFWLMIFFVSLVLAIASLFQPIGALFSFIGLGLARVPARAVFLAGLAVSVITAICVDAVASREVRKKYDPALFLSGVALAPVVICVGIWIFTGQVNLYLMIIALLSVLICGWLIAGEHSIISPGWWAPVFLGLLLIDLLTYDLLSVRWRTSEDVLSEGQWAVELLPEESSDALYRTYSPSYSIPQQTSAAAGIQMADGINPIQVSNYVDFMTETTGVPQTGYSVTIPAFTTWSIIWDNANYIPDAQKLGSANVCYIVSRFPLAVSEFELLGNSIDGLLYRNHTCQNRIRLEDAEGVVQNDPNIQVINYSPNIIQVEADGPGRLVVADNAFPEWIARVNGEREEINTVHSWMRSVEIPAGHNTVEFIYIPWSFYLGLVVSVLALFCCGVIWVKWK
jgi:hypothetical protein